METIYSVPPCEHGLANTRGPLLENSCMFGASFPCPLSPPPSRRSLLHPKLAQHPRTNVLPSELVLPNLSSPLCQHKLTVTPFGSLVKWLKILNWPLMLGRSDLNSLTWHFRVWAGFGLCAYTALPSGVMVCNDWDGSGTDQSKWASATGTLESSTRGHGLNVFLLYSTCSLPTLFSTRPGSFCFLPKKPLAISGSLFTPCLPPAMPSLLLLAT